MIQNNKKPEPAEHKIAQQKKRWLLWRILRWMGLGLLILWLIGAIIIQASWKLITLLAIILACCTILPKRFRKWFWLSAGVVVIPLIIWVFLPEDNEGWRPYTFDKELAALEAKYAIPDEENTFFAYDEISENLDIYSNTPEFFVTSKPSSKNEPWLSIDHPETAEWLKGHQNTIEKLLQAAQKDKCIFLPISADPLIYSKYTVKFSETREYAFLLVSAANNDMAEGRTHAALEKLFSIIQMARHSYQQPVIIQQFMGFAIESISLQQLNRFVIEGRPSEQQLKLLSSSLISAEGNWGSNLRNALDFEKLYYKNLFCSQIYETNPEGKVRFSRDPLASDRKHFPKELPPPTYFQKKLNKARTIGLWLSHSSSPEKISEIVDAGLEKCYAMTEPDFDWDKEPGKPRLIGKHVYRMIVDLLTTIQCSTYYKIHENYLKNLALRRGSHLLIAIKQYHIENNNWPESLDDIKSKAPAKAFIDPVNKNEFEYENHGPNFSLFGEKTNIWPK